MSNQSAKTASADDQRLTVGQVRENPWLVIEGMFAGVPLTRMLKWGDTCAAFFLKLEENEALARAYERAQSAAAELRADEIIDIADTEADPQVAKVRIDARRWWASKIKPKKFGERIDAHVTVEMPDLARAIDEGRNRAARVAEAQAAKAVAATLVLPSTSVDPDEWLQEPIRTGDASDEESVASFPSEERDPFEAPAPSLEDVLS